MLSRKDLLKTLIEKEVFIRGWEAGIGIYPPLPPEQKYLNSKILEVGDELFKCRECRREPVEKVVYYSIDKIIEIEVLE